MISPAQLLQLSQLQLQYLQYKLEQKLQAEQVRSFPFCFLLRVRMKSVNDAHTRYISSRRSGVATSLCPLQ